MIQLDSNGYTARIDSSRGGSCVQLSRFGADVLRTPSTVEDYETEPFFYGTPLLFFPNRISNGQFEFEGRTYKLPINEPDTGCFLHGMLHETPFEVIRSQAEGVTLLYRATPQAPYLTFPHAFTLILEWSLSAEGLLQTVTISNDSDENMPVALAFHTTFRLPFSDEGRADAVSMKLDTSLEFSRNMKNYLIVFNTLMRKAAQQGSVHPLYIDQLSSTMARQIEQVLSLDDGLQMLGRMVHKYCLLVKNHNMTQYSQPVQSVILRVDTELSGDLSLSAHAESIGVNASYLSSLFKKETGQTLTEYVTRRRIDYAIFLLNTTDMQIQTIAQHCGIPDVNYFTRSFRKVTGLTPTDYRAGIKGTKK